VSEESSGVAPGAVLVLPAGERTDAKAESSASDGVPYHVRFVVFEFEDLVAETTGE